MLLAIDVGNTNIKLGLYVGDKKCDKIWRMSTGQRRTSDEMGMFIVSLLQQEGYDIKKLNAVIISSVVPDIMYSLTHGIQKYFDITPIIVNYRMKMDIHLLKGSIKEVGADRLINCVAARALYPGAVIVVDYGTAVKYDVISEHGEFLTGITAPGIQICADALFQQAALIGKVELVLPPSIVAVNTTESVQAGLLYGRIGETEYIVSRLKRELGLPNARVIATGGLARVIAPGTDIFDDINPFLTLSGLKIMYDTNI